MKQWSGGVMALGSAALCPQCVTWKFRGTWGDRLTTAQRSMESDLELVVRVNQPWEAPVSPPQGQRHLVKHWHSLQAHFCRVTWVTAGLAVATKFTVYKSVRVSQCAATVVMFITVYVSVVSSKYPVNSEYSTVTGRPICCFYCHCSACEVSLMPMHQLLVCEV